MHVSQQQVLFFIVKQNGEDEDERGNTKITIMVGVMLEVMAAATNLTSYSSNSALSPPS